MKHIITIAISALMATLMWSCAEKNEWTVDGKINGAENSTMLLEASENGRWYLLDSVKTDEGGNFSISHKAVGYPDIYRLRLGNKTLYFPIDSIETVTVVTNADAFDTEYTVSGTPSSDRMMAVERKVKEVATKLEVNRIPNDSALKRQLTDIILQNPSDIVSYYIINKMVQGKPLFDPTNKEDLRIIGAVANAFTHYRPNDPRTQYLTNLFLAYRTRTSAPTDTLVANVINLIDVDLYDKSGKRRQLNEVAQNNRIVVLNFTAYAAEFAPALNIELNKLYEKYHSAGLEIYQVSVDQNEVTWREASKALPWITVYKPINDNSPILNYNVGILPLTYIIESGEVVERIIDQSKIRESVSKRF